MSEQATDVVLASGSTTSTAVNQYAGKWLPSQQRDVQLRYECEGDDALLLSVSVVDEAAGTVVSVGEENVTAATDLALHINELLVCDCRLPCISSESDVCCRVQHVCCLVAPCAVRREAAEH